MKAYIILFLIFTITPVISQENSVGIFDNNLVAGNSEKAGYSTYDSEDQTYTLNGVGSNVEQDKINYLYNLIKGDFIITANIQFKDEGTVPSSKVGLMIRESQDEGAAYAKAVLHADGSTFFQWRESVTSMDREDQISSPKTNYGIFQLERKGEEIIMRAAHWGEPLQVIGSKDSPLPAGEVLVGLFIDSPNGEVVETATAWNVRIDKPVANDYDPGEEGWLGCRLETINVENGMRKQIYEKEDRFEAPNWMPGGDELLFNMDGSLYTINVEGGDPEKFDTGFADNLNNDHGISFNGEMIAISHHPPGEGSKVYVLPIEGGTPRLVTDEDPSYWHGWAPNNEEVVYVATRENNPTYDIYKKSIHGGEEVALTNTGEGEHVDGCEYSPDGEYIYYNGSASGTMQIWRMRPDGSNKEQLTFDARNDWFPHISPDGKWIAYISFPSEIPVNDHPSYKRVTLNLMPTAGGAPKVIAYLYGGQGSINVPSWSPDSKHLAFVSNSGK
ncbi:biopolymer transporter TolR [Salegentibacter sp. JZCK2]|uniref:TolB family protein n=1 Tax=Salegentibacter tibetensis TaxID=2873600 RepID=UPI001CCC4189|nr:biopolymer transporter TolR [Salegentibacter tibetensis]MBZ9730072.1 biopolymer transporter TolR [Salegentibacter tibetensis]